jgi:hypothetical protein
MHVGSRTMCNRRGDSIANAASNDVRGPRGGVSPRYSGIVPRPCTYIYQTSTPLLDYQSTESP